MATVSEGSVIMAASVPEGFETMALAGEFAHTVGPFYQKRTAGGWRFGMLAEPRHTNPAGVVHGGVLITFLDHVLGKLVWDALKGEIAATVSLNADLLAAAKPGDWIEAEGKITRRTRSLVFIRGRAYLGDKAIATASGVWKVQKPG